MFLIMIKVCDLALVTDIFVLLAHNSLIYFSLTMKMSSSEFYKRVKI